MIHRVKVKSLEHDSWNAMIDELSQRLPIRCVVTGRKWRHPWHITPSWDDEAGWVMQINPGFINGKEPDFSIPATLAGPRTLDRIEAETGERPSNDDPVVALLTEGARIPVGGARMIGKGAIPESTSFNSDGNVSLGFEKVPDFFKKLGVMDESIQFSSNLNSGIQLIEGDPTEKEKEPRLLRAMEVGVTVDRFTAKLDVLRGNGFLDFYNALYFVAYGRNAPMKEFPSLLVSSKFRHQEVDEVSAALQETSETDFIKIATVFFLSPVGFDPVAPMDGSWTPYVSHDVFWNMAHAPQRLPDLMQFEPIRIRTGLIAGLADSIFSGVLSTFNDEMSAAVALSQLKNLSGRFWTL